MNDGSTDETARVARSYGATVVDVVDDTDAQMVWEITCLLSRCDACMYESHCLCRC